MGEEQVTSAPAQRTPIRNTVKVPPPLASLAVCTKRCKKGATKGRSCQVNLPSGPESQQIAIMG